MKGDLTETENGLWRDFIMRSGNIQQDQFLQSVHEVLGVQWVQAVRWIRLCQQVQ